MRIIHFCPDDRASSGINKFCSELNRHLVALGVDSSIIRTPSDLATSHQPPPAILHLHEMWLPSVHAAAAWARQKGVPIVWSTHGMTAPWSMRHKWWKKLPAWWLYQKRDLRSAALIHCTAEQEVAWNVKLGFKNCIVVPLGTDCRIEGLTDCRIGGLTDFRVLFVGRIYPVKGLMNLVRAIAIINQSIKQSVKLSIRLVGPDQAGHRAELEAECERLGVKNVQFVGEKHGAELDAEYEACDVLVLPSFTENFGGVVVDALSHGKPVIASKFTPWRELEEKGCGWWVDNAPESLAKTIAAAASLPREKRIEMGEKGRALVEAKYTWQAVAKAMIEGYEKVRE